MTWRAPGAAPCPAASTARLKYSGIVKPAEHRAGSVQMLYKWQRDGTVLHRVSAPGADGRADFVAPSVCVGCGGSKSTARTCDPGDGQEAKDSRQPWHCPSLRQADAEAV
jgi:hypothetical protein